MTKTTVSISTNPNKWEKHMAPWHNAECKEAKRHCTYCRQNYGRSSQPAVQAYKDYRKCCVRNRTKLQLQLPDIIKYQPKQFWKLLKHSDHDITALKLEDFANHNRALFHDTSVPEAEYAPVTNPTTQHITPEELTHTLQFAFKANKSSGLSQMPLQLLKHMSAQGIACVASFLNKSAID
jgi:hypothetical protein